jgi:hypothetical protein
MYDINPLLNAATTINGTGQKLAVMGETEIYQSDINDFRTGFGLPAISCTTAARCRTTSSRRAATPTSATWWVECAPPACRYGRRPQRVRPGSRVVRGRCSRGAGRLRDFDDTFTSFYYAIDNQTTLGESVISLSYGACEFDANIGEFANGL